jgi:hypothetical protein
VSGGSVATVTGMPRDIFMTWYRLGLVFVGVCGVVWFLAQSLLADVRIEQGETVKPSYGVASLRNAVLPRYKHIPDDNFRHIHWFVQVSILNFVWSCSVKGAT